jgi:hypothetical protein
VDPKEAQALKESNAALTTEVGRLREGMILRDAKDLAGETLRAIEMPDMTRARLMESVVANPPVKDGTLDREAFVAAVKEAATREIAYVQSLAGAGAIRGMGPTAAGAGTLEESRKALDGAMTRLIGAPKAAVGAAS